MGYADYLRGLLRPLGVYELSAGSFSGGAVEALGAALDQAWEAMQKSQRETLVPTAEGDGLAGILPESRDIAGRRAAVAALLAVGGESFSAAALSRSLAACGVEAAVRETDAAGTVVVSFPGCMGKPDGFARMAEIIERLPPCGGILFSVHALARPRGAHMGAGGADDVGRADGIHRRLSPRAQGRP